MDCKAVKKACGVSYGLVRAHRKNVVPRDELHTCHLVKPKAKKGKKNGKVAKPFLEPPVKKTVAEQEGPEGKQLDDSVVVLDPVVPDLPNYFNNKAENSRLQDAKERCGNSNGSEQLRWTGQYTREKPLWSFEPQLTVTGKLQLQSLDHT